jgi:hypothetical protein
MGFLIQATVLAKAQRRRHLILKDLRRNEGIYDYEQTPK